MTGSIRIFLVDDHRMFREGIAALVSSDPEITVVGQSSGGYQTIQEIQQIQPDVVVMDISLPELDGLDICRELTRGTKKTAVLILTMYDDPELIAKALDYGACGYLVKEAAGDQLLAAIHSVGRGEIFVGPAYTPDAEKTPADAGNDPYELLTTRERQVLRLIAEGRTNPQISRQLGLAVKTINNHRMNLMRKLNIHDQTTLLKFALRKGLATLD